MAGSLRLVLRSGELDAEVALDGAELVGLRYRGAHELLWHGDAAVWERISPILFPVVGRTHDGVIEVGGRRYPMPMHGFAHASAFEVAEVSASSCRLVLTDSARTREHYPYAFRLALGYALDGARLSIEAALSNPGATPLPASFGFHPGLRWPLEPGRPKTDYAITFPDDTDALVAMLPHDGRILPERTTTPLMQRTLNLSADLFRTGSLVFLAPVSRRLDYGAPGAALALRIETSGLPQLAVWSRPPGDFVCIEPWCGQPEPIDFTGPFERKPGLATIAPGDTRRFGMTIEVVERRV